MSLMHHSHALLISQSCNFCVHVQLIFKYLCLSIDRLKTPVAKQCTKPSKSMGNFLQDLLQDTEVTSYKEHDKQHAGHIGYIVLGQATSKSLHYYQITNKPCKNDRQYAYFDH